MANDPDAKNNSILEANPILRQRPFLKKGAEKQVVWVIDQWGTEEDPEANAAAYKKSTELLRQDLQKVLEENKDSLQAMLAEQNRKPRHPAQRPRSLLPPSTS